MLHGFFFGISEKLGAILELIANKIRTANSKQLQHFTSVRPITILQLLFGKKGLLEKKNTYVWENMKAQKQSAIRKTC